MFVDFQLILQKVKQQQYTTRMSFMADIVMQAATIPASMIKKAMKKGVAKLLESGCNDENGSFLIGLAVGNGIHCAIWLGLVVSMIYFRIKNGRHHMKHTQELPIPAAGNANDYESSETIEMYHFQRIETTEQQQQHCFVVQNESETQTQPRAAISV